MDTSDRPTGDKMADVALVGYPWQIVIRGRYNPDAFEVRQRGGEGRDVSMTYDEFVSAVAKT